MFSDMQDMIDVFVPILIVYSAVMAVAGIVLIILAIKLPKNKAIGVILAILFGPLAYIYVGKWGKAIGLWAISIITLGLAGFFIWIYSMVNICTEIDRFHEDRVLRDAQLHQAQEVLGQPPSVGARVSGQPQPGTPSVQPAPQPAPIQHSVPQPGVAQPAQPSPQPVIAQPQQPAVQQAPPPPSGVQPLATPGGLIVLEGANQGRMYPLAYSLITIGREESNSISVPESDQRASRFHAEISYEGGAFYLKDKNSTNGTFVNGQRITASQPLREGDRVQIGDIVFQFTANASGYM